MATKEVKEGSKDQDTQQLDEFFGFSLKVNNNVDPNDKTVFYAWCDFTTMKLQTDPKTGESKLKSTQIKKGDEITPAEVPWIWIRQAIICRHLIPKEDKEKFSTSDLRRKGYSVAE